jgi:DNA processing protein
VSRRIRPGETEWPRGLSELEAHLSVGSLFAEGLPMPAERPAVAVVGTRRPTAAGLEAAYDIARALAEAGWVVVSGLARGIDAMAHRAAMEAGGHTVAVLGCGLDVDYPRANTSLRRRIAAEGTLLTEYPASAPPARHHFPLRNRIIAGLSRGVVVVEGAPTSGALVTARLALEANRSVYAVPGGLRNPMAAGPNHLIRTLQASLVTSADHVFEDLAPALAWTVPPRSGGSSELDPHEARVLGAREEVPSTPDRLAGALGLAPGRLAATLSLLEIRGLVARDPAGYALTRAGGRALVRRGDD